MLTFDGVKFRRTSKVVILPNKDEQGNLFPFVKPNHEHYIHFGRIVPLGRPVPANAVMTQYTWNDLNNTKVWAVPVPEQAHGLTNKVYSSDGYTYLAYKGSVYISGR